MAAVGVKKVLLSIINVIYMIIAILLIIAGAIVLANSKNLKGYTGYGVGLLIVGGVLLVVAILGCVAAIKESYMLLYVFAVIVTLILLAEIVMAIVGFVKRGKIRQQALLMVNMTMSEYGDDEDVTKHLDSVMSSVHCCGLHDYKSWRNTPWGKKNPGDVPDSCCKKKTIGCGEGVLLSNKSAAETVFMEGCFDKMGTALEHASLWIAIASLIFATLQFFGVVMACCMARTLRKDYQNV